ncbi:MAG: hypothetical protein ACI4KH_05980 [Oscillospiraceae bacterium]
MGRPPKSVQALTSEGKSHRTKAEIEVREQGEKEVQSGRYIIERKEVRKDKIAHKEFQRLRLLLDDMDKADELYSSVINRYCQLYSESRALEVQKEEFYALIKETKDTFNEAIKDLTPVEKANLIFEFTAEINRLIRNMNAIDSNLMAKRKMMFDIEKENIMTVSAGLRAIPKEPQGSEENPLIKALSDDDSDE